MLFCNFLQVYEKFGGKNLFFRTCSLEDAVSGTLFENPQVMQRVLSSDKRMIHTSDVLRQLFLSTFALSKKQSLSPIFPPIRPTPKIWDRPIRPKPDDRIYKNHLTEYFLPYDWINRKPDDQIYLPLVTLLRRAIIYTLFS